MGETKTKSASGLVLCVLQIRKRQKTRRGSALEVIHAHFRRFGNWCTPQDFFDKLNEEFGFVLDAAATAKTANCAQYFTPETDGLKSSWNVEKGAVFCNPPYGREIGKWVKKAYEESQEGAQIVLLIPARTDTTYFHNYIYGKAEIRFIRGRLRFTDEDGKASDPAPFPSMLVIYNKEAKLNEQ